MSAPALPVATASPVAHGVLPYLEESLPAEISATREKLETLRASERSYETYLARLERLARAFEGEI